VAVLAPASNAAAGGCANAHMKPRGGNAGKVRSATICLLNRQRAKHGLGKIRGNVRLRKAATRHSRDMVRRRYFDHVAPGGETLTDRARHARYLAHASRSWWLAENIAWGSGYLATPASIVNQWMHSPPHRANILDGRMRDAGIGVATGSPRGGGGATYTLALGRVS
jgi:uncharacterized protein YkwD